jgi:hypothetical protein
MPPAMFHCDKDAKFALPRLSGATTDRNRHDPESRVPRLLLRDWPKLGRCNRPWRPLAWNRCAKVVNHETTNDQLPATNYERSRVEPPSAKEHSNLRVNSTHFAPADLAARRLCQAPTYARRCKTQQSRKMPAEQLHPRARHSPLVSAQIQSPRPDCRRLRLRGPQSACPRQCEFRNPQLASP